MQILKYILWAISAFYIILGGIIAGEPMGWIIGLIFLSVSFFIKTNDVISNKIEETISDYRSSKAQDDLLKLKKLLNEGILTQEEYDKKAIKIKEKL